MSMAIFGMYVSFMMIFLSFSTFKENQELRIAFIILSIGLLIFSLYRMCKVNDKVRSIFLRLFDVLFWWGK